MFIKTLKHDLINSFKEYTNLYITMILLAVLAPFGLKSGNEILISLSVFALVIILVMSFVLTLMNAIGFLKRRLFEEGAYFNLTLPVSLDTTLMSKLTTINIWFFVTFIIGSISMVIFAMSLDGQVVQILQRLLDNVLEIIKNIDPIQFVLAFIRIIVGLYSINATVLFAMTMVNTSYFRKTNYLIAILIFFFVTFIQGWITQLLEGLLIGNTTQMLMQNEMGVLLNTPYISIILLVIDLLFFVAMYGLTRYLFDRKLEI